MFNNTAILGPIPSMYPLYSPRYCVLYLDMHSGNGVMQDHSGRGNTGTVSGAAQSAGPSGLVRKFDGVDDYISIATDIIGTGAFTVEAWIFPTGWGEGVDGTHGLGNIVNNSQFIFELSQANGGVTAGLLGLFDNVTVAKSANNSISLSVWQHVALVRNKTSKATFYVNGAISGTAEQSGGTPVAGSTVYIGNRAAGDRTFAGSIAIVRFYNTSLAAADISASYRKDAWRYSLKG